MAKFSTNWFLIDEILLFVQDDSVVFLDWGGMEAGAFRARFD